MDNIKLNGSTRRKQKRRSLAGLTGRQSTDGQPRDRRITGTKKPDKLKAPTELT